MLVKYDQIPSGKYCSDVIRGEYICPCLTGKRTCSLFREIEDRQLEVEQNPEELLEKRVIRDNICIVNSPKIVFSSDLPSN
jgi:hypothetical protein